MQFRSRSGPEAQAQLADVHALIEEVVAARRNRTFETWACQLEPDTGDNENLWLLIFRLATNGQGQCSDPPLKKSCRRKVWTTGRPKSRIASHIKQKV